MAKTALKSDRITHFSASDAADGGDTLVSGADAIERAATAFTEIEERGGAATPFQTFAFARSAARVHAARGEDLQVAIVRDEGRAMALIAAVTARWYGIPTLRFLGDPLTQYGDALAAPEASRLHIERAWRLLATRSGASFAWLRKVRADSALAALLDVSATPIASDRAPYVDLIQPAAINGRDARELRRCRRRLAERGDVAFGVCEGEAALPWLHQALALKRDWLVARGLPSRVIGDPFWEGVIARMTDQRGPTHLAAAHLTCGGETVAIEIGLIYRQTWYAFIGSTAPKFAKCGPGQIQMAETLARASARGLTRYDLLAPSQAYKTAIAHGEVAIKDYGVAFDWRGHAALYAAQLAPSVKSTVALMPEGFRRFALSPARDPENR